MLTSRFDGRLKCYFMMVFQPQGLFSVKFGTANWKEYRRNRHGLIQGTITNSAFKNRHKLQRKILKLE